MASVDLQQQLIGVEAVVIGELAGMSHLPTADWQHVVLTISADNLLSPQAICLYTSSVVKRNQQ